MSMPTNILAEAQGEQCFWVNNGPIVKSLPELKTAILEMSDEKFDYHTKREGNDFAKWAEEVLGSKKLSASLSRAKTKKGTVKAIEKHLN
jgi:hypothetical protein